MFHGVEPIFLRRAFRTSSALPEFMGENCDVAMGECGDAMANGGPLGVLVRFRGVLEGLARRLVSRQVLLFAVLLGNAMGMRCNVV
jgi:hypothetical protein